MLSVANPCVSRFSGRNLDQELLFANIFCNTFFWFEAFFAYFILFEYAAEYFRDWRVILINLTNSYKLLHLFNTKLWNIILYFEKAEGKWNEIEVFIQLFLIAQLFIDILWWGSIKLQILKLEFRFNAKISNFFSLVDISLLGSIL